MLFGLPNCDTVKETFGWMNPGFCGVIKAGNADVEVTYKTKLKPDHFKRKGP